MQSEERAGSRDYGSIFAVATFTTPYDRSKKCPKVQAEAPDIPEAVEFAPANVLCIFFSVSVSNEG